ncbi:MAG: hypothetical protein ABSH56_08050 [Bryobacteraceae bacterium]|jgi:hypothetical protein
MDTTGRDFISVSLVSPLLASAAAPGRPNVLVVVLDDLGCHDLGYLGADDLRTPNIDAIAERGLKFRNARSRRRRLSFQSRGGPG